MRFASGLFATVALLTAGAANATITIYTTLASFNAAVSAPATDTFQNFSITGPTPSPVTRAIGAYSYQAAASTSTFFGAGTNADHWLSTNLATDTIIFSNFTGGVKGVGGLFFGSDIGGNFASANQIVTATDGSGTVTQTLISPTTSSFLGFVTTGAFTTVTVAAVQGNPDVFWPTVNNLVLGAAGAPAVPEPATWTLLIAGFGLTGTAMRRKVAATA